MARLNYADIDFISYDEYVQVDTIISGQSIHALSRLASKTSLIYERTYKRSCL